MSVVVSKKKIKLLWTLSGTAIVRTVLRQGIFVVIEYTMFSLFVLQIGRINAKLLPQRYCHPSQINLLKQNPLLRNQLVEISN